MPISPTSGGATSVAGSKRIRRWPTRTAPEKRRVLIAGCGTSQAAKHALRQPEATVVGIDVSETSLTETRRIADRHGLSNLELQMLPIEQVSRLDAEFDQIVCTGVLHHLVDPAVGLRALAGVLAEGGVIDMMLYAPFGRTGVYMIQDYCRRLGIRPVADDIAELVDALRELPAGHPIGHLLRTSPDFADDDALADALLNPRDRSFSVPELMSLLDDAGLRFDRWVRQAPYRPQCGSMSSLAHRTRIEALPVPEQSAAMELFRGTMVRHSLLASRAAGIEGDPADRIDDVLRNPVRARRAVPVLDPATVLLGERLPHGAVAAALNRAHTDPDLVLFLNEGERDVVTRIDGLRTIGELGGDLELHRRLWLHDLVVVDAVG